MSSVQLDSRHLTDDNQLCAAAAGCDRHQHLAFPLAYISTVSDVLDKPLSLAIGKFHPFPILFD